MSEINQKIRKTKLETEELENQLQNLIDEGKKLICPSQSNQNLDPINEVNLEKPLNSPNKVQIIKSYDKHSVNRSNIPPEKTEGKLESKPLSPKKTKTYDVKQAREYIKKQKEIHTVKQKRTQEEQRIKAEVQKKKLAELNKKSRELLAKNVQAKRERSRSRDNNVYVRPDEADNLTSKLKMTKSLDRVDNAVSPLQKNPNLLYLPDPNLKNSISLNAQNEDPGKIVILAGNYTRIGAANSYKQKKMGNTNIFKETNLENIPVKTNMEKSQYSPKINQSKSKDKILVEKKSNSGKNLKSVIQEELKPKVLFTSYKEDINLPISSSKDNLESVKNILEYKSNQSSKSHSNLISKPSDVVIEEKVEQKVDTGIFNEKKGTPEMIKLLPTTSSAPSIQRKKDPVNKCSVEIQTESSTDVHPKWLEEQPPQAYPFNFINTIKRKLQVATMQKTTSDVGIQSSVVESISNREIEKTAGQSRSHDSLKRSDLKSFISHKCLNLDPKTIEHLELVPRKNYSKDTNVIFQNLQTQTSSKINQTESESDTSKNIKEISSESDTSLKKNAESVKRAFLINKSLANINTDRIDNMKLIPHDVASNTNTIRTDSKLTSKLVEPSELSRSTESKQGRNTLSVDNRYTGDFDSDVDVSSESLDRSRRSIISFNRSGYNLVFIPSPDVSPQKSVSTVNTEILLNQKTDNISKSVEDIQKNVNVYSTNVSDKTSNISFTNPSKNEIRTSNRDSRKSGSASISSLSKSDFSLSGSGSNKNKKLNTNQNKDNQIKPPSIGEKITSSKNSSVHTETQPSSSIITNASKSDGSLKYINTQRGSSGSIENKKSEISPLIEPAVALVKVSEDGDVGHSESSKKFSKNISVKSGKISTNGNTNQIHLKFEAEIHLLNDFNESLRRFSALEQALETLKTNNTITTSNILQNNAQTSLTARSKTSSKITEHVIQSKNSQSQNSRINYSRGSFINSSLGENLDQLANSALDLDNSIVSTGLEISNFNTINQSLSAQTDDPFTNVENLHAANFAGVSINMFEQLIKDEDVRLENLKTILKIREQALLDRTKSELAWLEIQRKHFKETGKLHEASGIKKKQRGILVNHQKEKHEMQRLKQMQKAASIERKIVLKEQRNLIRQQLSTDNMLTKMKVNTPRERRLSGPLKVLQSHTESIRSETSVSRKSSGDKDKDILSVTSHHSVTSHSVVSEISEIEFSRKDMPSLEHQKYIKRTLLMREAALKKRRKAAEELLQWHKKLLEEEKRIAILESTASAIISQKPSSCNSGEKFNFKGKQLNQLWFNLTESKEKKFVDDKIYPMSQIALERFCKGAREFSRKGKTLLKANEDNDNKSDVSVSENILTERTGSENIVSERDYLSDFENESIATQDVVDVVDQSIDLLINNFNKIQDDISTLSIIQTKKSGESSILSESPNFDKTESEVEISVIETNRTDANDRKKSSDKSKSVPPEISTETKDSGSPEDVKETINESIPSLDQNSLDSDKIVTENSGPSFENNVNPIEENILEKSNSENISEKVEKSKLSADISAVLSNHKLETDISDNLAKSKDSTRSDSKLTEQLSDLKSSEANLSLKSLTQDNASGKPESDSGSEIIPEKLSKSTPLIQNKQMLDNLVPNLIQDIAENSKSLKLSIEEDICVPLSDLQSLEERNNVFVNVPVSDVNSTNNSVSEELKSLLLNKETLVDEQSIEGILKTDQIITERSKTDHSSNKSSVPIDHENIKLSSSHILEIKDTSENRRFIDGQNSVPESQKSSSKLLLNAEENTFDDAIPTIASDSNVSKDGIIEDIESQNTQEEEIVQKEQFEVEESDNNQIPEYIAPVASETKESLNESQEILLMLGESALKTNSNEEIPEIQIKDSLNTSEEILSKLSEQPENEAQTTENNSDTSESSSKTDEDLLSQSLLKLYQISKSDDSKIIENDSFPVSLVLNTHKSNKDEQSKINFDNIEECFEDNNESQERDFENVNEDMVDIIEDIKVSNEESNEIINLKTNIPFEIDENNENQTFLNNLVASGTEINVQQDIHEESDESKLALSDKSNESFVINEMNDDSNEKLEEHLPISEQALGEPSDKQKIEDGETPRDKTDEYSSIMEDVEEESEPSKTTSHFSYGILPKSEEISVSCETESVPSKEDVNSFEEKEHDSLSSANGGSSSEALNLEEQSSAGSEVAPIRVDIKSCKEVAIDVKKRISEILADSNVSRGDKSPRLQDLYVTTYDLISPPNSPEKGTSSPKDDHKLVSSIFDSEAEEILRKQLAVEEEIKAITEQQQKQQVPLMYIREIPNKPPPPYTPPSSIPSPPVPTIIPTSDEIEEITMYSAKILHKAYLSNNLANVSISNNTLSLISKDISKDCYKFVFDLCKDIAREHYKQFEEDNSPSWLRVSKQPELTLIKPFDPEGLKAHMIRRLKEIFGYQKLTRRENAIIKWSRKKRDHVDEILVMECQQEEPQWTNYQKDELLVKDEITNDIFDSLLKDTAQMLQKIFLKRS